MRLLLRVALCLAVPLADAGAQGALTLVGSADAGFDVTYVLVSPDDRFVLATRRSVRSVVSFARDAVTGGLTLRDEAVEGAGGVTGLDYPTDPGIDPQGRHLYVPGFVVDSLVVLSVDAAGELDFVEVQVDGIAGVNGLDGPNVARVSPDGRFVYAGSAGGITVFARDAATGSLDFAGLTPLPPDTNDVIALAHATNGRALYALAGSGVYTYARDPSSGLLTLIDSEIGDVGGGTILDTPRSLAVGRDGRRLYVGTSSNLFTFTRAANGALSFADQLLADGQDVRVALAHDGNRLWTSSRVCGAFCTYKQTVYPLSPTTALPLAGELGLFQNKEMDPGRIAASRDGRHLYVTDAESRMIDVAAVDPLTFLHQVNERSGGVDGLSGARSLAASPDGRHVYVASYLDDAVAAFSRDAQTGALGFVETERDEVAGVSEMNGATHVTVSADGKHVYVCAYIDDAVNVFSRNPATGALTFAEAEKDGVGAVQGLNFANASALSPDGKHLYVVGFNDDALSVFSRNPDTGALELVEEQRNGIGGVVGFDGPADVAVSPDGGRVVTANSVGDSLTTFARDASTGVLDFIGSVTAAPFLDEVVGVAISRDGRHVYAAASAADTVTAWVFGFGGGLSLINLWTDQGGPVRGLDGAHDIAVSADDRLVVVAGLNPGSVAAFWRSQGSGSLGFAQAELDGFVDGLGGAHGVAVSPDGRHVFVAGQSDDAIVVFAPEAGSAAAIAAAGIALAALAVRGPARRRS